MWAFPVVSHWLAPVKIQASSFSPERAELYSQCPHFGHQDHTRCVQRCHQAWHAVESSQRSPPSPQGAQETWGPHYWVWSDLSGKDSPDVKNHSWAGSSIIVNPCCPRTDQGLFQSSRISGLFYQLWTWRRAQGWLLYYWMFSREYIIIFPKKSHDHPNRCRQSTWQNLTPFQDKSSQQIRYI